MRLDFGDFDFLQGWQLSEHIEKPFFTVFTPVYNRRNTLYRVWDSLQDQTCRDFEWIIVDDGSTDGVEDLLAQYQQQATFPITIIRQPNQGKHVAWNRAVDISKGELFLPADSDDSFVPTTLDRFRTAWESIPAQERGRFSGVNCLCIDPETRSVIGQPYPQDRMVSDNLELCFRFGIMGEKWGVIRTDLLRQRPFPVIPGSCYPMTYLWFGFARDYRVLCINEVLRHYYHDQPNHISASDRSIGRAAAQRRHFGCWHLNTNWDYLAKVRWGRIKAAAGTARASIECRNGIVSTLQELRGLHRRLLFLAMLPVAYFYWRY